MRLSRIPFMMAVAALAACSDATTPTTTGIGSSGGKAASSNNSASVSIPAGALSANTVVTVAAVANPPAQSGLVGGAAYDFGPTGTTFAAPVTISITYDPATIPAGVAESSLQLSTLSGSTWTVVAGSSVNTTTHTVTGNTTHFSSYAPLGTLAPVATVTLTPAAPSVAIGATTQLSAALADAAGAALTGRVVTWTTSDATKATVSATGLVTGVAAGTATITATSEGKTGTATVTVIVPPVATVAVGGASSVFTGYAIQLTATTKDAAGNTLAGRVVTWATSDATKATVNATGGVTGVASGTVTITATSEGKSGSATITVSPPPVASVVVSSAINNIAVGATATLTANTSDANGVTLTGRVVTWATSDATKATVSSSGVVTGVAVGSATITATSEGVNGTATVNVSAAQTGGSVPIGLVAITSGPLHSCGLNASGAAYCWGNGGNGLGDGTSKSSLVPVAVTGGLTFNNINAYDNLSCGITSAGVLYCWGGGSQLFSFTATQPAQGITFAQVSVGTNQTCGVATDGTGYCVGSNTYGRLGSGQSQAALPASSTFLPVAGGLKFKQISVSNWSSCGVTTSGALYCWGNIAGYNNGTGAVSTSATPVLITSAVAFASLTPHIGTTSACGLTAAGSVYCIGTDVTDIGGASSTSYQAPRAIAASMTFKSISYGTAMCGVTSANALYCWGNNATGALGQGNGSAGSSTTPLVVSSGKTFTSVDASDAGTTCAVQADGTGLCWGYNFNGQVGDGTTVNKFSPVAISGGLTYRAP